MSLVLYSKIEEAQRRCWILGTIVDECDILAACCSYVLSVEQMATIDIISQRREAGKLTIASDREPNTGSGGESAMGVDVGGRSTIASLPSELLSLIRSSIFQMIRTPLLRQLHSVASGSIASITQTPEAQHQPLVSYYLCSKVPGIWAKYPPDWLQFLNLSNDMHIPEYIKRCRACELVNDCLARFGCTAIFGSFGGNPIGPLPMVITHFPLPTPPSDREKSAKAYLRRRKWSDYNLLEHLKEYHELPFPSHEEEEVYKHMLQTLGLSPVDLERRVPTAIFIPADVVYDLMYLPK
jgi:hypothetical protein